MRGIYFRSVVYDADWKLVKAPAGQGLVPGKAGVNAPTKSNVATAVASREHMYPFSLLTSLPANLELCVEAGCFTWLMAATCYCELLQWFLGQGWDVRIVLRLLRARQAVAGMKPTFIDRPMLSVYGSTTEEVNRILVALELLLPPKAATDRDYVQVLRGGKKLTKPVKHLQVSLSAPVVLATRWQHLLQVDVARNTRALAGVILGQFSAQNTQGIVNVVMRQPPIISRMSVRLVTWVPSFLSLGLESPDGLDIAFIQADDQDLPAEVTSHPGGLVEFLAPGVMRVSMLTFVGGHRLDSSFQAHRHGSEVPEGPIRDQPLFNFYTAHLTGHGRCLCTAGGIPAQGAPMEIWLGALPQHRVIQTMCQFYRDNGITFNNPPPLMPNLFIGPQHEFILYLIGLCHHNRLGFDLVMHLSMDVSFGRLPLVDMDPTIAMDEMPALDEDGINPPIIYHLGTHGWITAMAFGNVCDELLDPRNFRLLQSEIYYLVRAVDRKLRTKFTSYIIVNSITSELNNQLPDSEDPGHCTYTVYVRFRPNEERACILAGRVWGPNRPPLLR